ncbi:MAG: cation diffusion facilitator family transporter [Burkholderiaceae bacterium]|jgi:cation diffusion facilitator family transporter|nr:cation diffusion facilitator family transporter [Burkholderiaceae bacterium]
MPVPSPSTARSPTHRQILTNARALLYLSIGVALCTMILKGAAGYITHSMGLISDAMESIVNLASAVFALVMVTVAARPADTEHPYGHHKAEYFASGFEGMMIAIAGALIIGAAVPRLLAPRAIEQVGWGLALSVLSSLANAAMAWVLLRAARVQNSIALEADARHLMADVWTSAAVVVGVLAVHVSGWLWLDPVIAIAVAIHIMIEGTKLVWRSSSGLMDSALEPQLQQALRAALEQTLRASPDGPEVRMDDLVTRRAGQRRFADLHMHVPGDWPLHRAAALRDAVEQALMEAVPGLRVGIQLLPLDMEARAVQADQRNP